MTTALPLLPTTLVGSYPQPDWLVDREVLLGTAPPRVRQPTLWRLAGAELAAGQDEAARMAIADQESAGLDIVTDGEVRRESYFNRFATALDGITLDPPGYVLNRMGKRAAVPRVTGPIRRREPIEVAALRFLRAQAKRAVKMTVPGPFTLAQLCVDEHYGDERRLALAYAAAVNEELRALEAAGADFLQLDEPYLQAQPERARRHGIEAIDRALDGLTAPTIVHLCFGYAYIVADKPSGYSFLPELGRSRARQISIEAAQPRLDLSALRSLGDKTVLVGVIDLGDPAIEPAALVAERIRAALAVLPPERVVVAPDCGLKYLARDVAFGKMKAMVEGARLVRDTL